MKGRRLRISLALALAAVGVWVLAGCIYIPTPGKAGRGVNAGKYVGGGRSDKPIRTSTSTLDDVLAVLGPPRHASADGRSIGYTWSVPQGTWVGICYSARPLYHHQLFRLDFDQDGTLVRFTAIKENRAITQALNSDLKYPWKGDWRAPPNGH